MIMLWGLLEDGPLARVYQELQHDDAPVVFVDQRDVLHSEIALDVGATISGTVRVAGRTVDVEEVTAAYLRPYDSWRIGAVARAGRDSAECRHALGFDDTLWLWAELTSARVVNRPSAMASNSSKPRQAMTISAHGFGVPDTLITTDPDAARAFQADHGTVVYKSVSGIRSIVSRLGQEHDDRLQDVAWCPTQFQQYVPGDDYRVHVVGDEVFATRIQSAADDYRYGSKQGATVAMEPVILPPEWAQRCRALAADLDFALAGIDLRLTPDGEWYCFEVNPSPGFTFYDRRGQGIGRAVAGLLREEPAR
ncbi:ATP-grasp domain-containing protein [Amycolatopsis pithecellobii]|uniref:RimK domain-containing protein ATP-grasp n=1 Tax=Amycolatopsis pithecellobii TaxID=664692 RepID=A0A6N7YQF9_9PSEU|nr:RimK domain-containing protein ATP-grasp [Amycolatopsis pithecellobii]MTD55245.1 RimK domain-containing protein ATP-grasp [Amycolatopsis pithecellobii]